MLYTIIYRCECNYIGNNDTKINETILRVDIKM